MPTPPNLHAPHKALPRRTLLGWLAAVPLLSLIAPGLARAALSPAPSVVPTPADDIGPFYPLDWSGEQDSDLTRFGPPGSRAEGTPLRITGQVLNLAGQPLSGATVEIWQADARGRYRHPGVDPRTRDPRFQGFGRTRSGRDGQFAFVTVMPGRYGGRPPHVHFRVATPDGRELVTQMYFHGDNRDLGLPPSADRQRLSVATRPDAQLPGALNARFDLILG